MYSREREGSGRKLWLSKDEEILQLWLQLSTVLRDRSFHTYSSFVSRDTVSTNIYGIIFPLWNS